MSEPIKINIPDGEKRVIVPIILAGINNFNSETNEGIIIPLNVDEDGKLTIKT